MVLGHVFFESDVNVFAAYAPMSDYSATFVKEFDGVLRGFDVNLFTAELVGSGVVIFVVLDVIVEA